MSESRTLAELAAMFAGEVHGDPETRVSKVATLQSADASSISFLSNPKYASQLAATSAGASDAEDRNNKYRKLNCFKCEFQ